MKCFGACSIRLGADEAAVVVHCNGSYYIASRHHLARFDLHRNMCRYDPSLRPVFDDIGLGADDTPELVAALARMGLAKRLSAVVMSTSTENNWASGDGSKVPASTKRELMKLALNPTKFGRAARRATLNGLGAPRQPWAVLTLATAPKGMVQELLLRCGSALCVLDPQSDRALQAALDFYGEPQKVARIEAAHELMFYVDFPPKGGSASATLVQLEGEWLEFGILDSTTTHGMLVSKIGAGPLLLCGASGPKAADAYVFPGAVLKAIVLPDGDEPMDEEGKWAAIIRDAGAWLGPGPFVGGALRIAVVGVGYFFTRPFEPGTTYGAVHDAVFGFDCNRVQLYDPAPVARGDAVRVNCLWAVMVLSPKAIEIVRTNEHYAENGMSIEAIHKIFADVDRRQQPPRRGVKIDYDTLEQTIPPCVSKVGRYKQRWFVAMFYVSIGVADDVPIGPDFEATVLHRLQFLAGPSGDDMKRLKKTILKMKWLIQKDAQPKRMCHNQQFCVMDDQRQCPMFSNDTPIADTFKKHCGTALGAPKYKSCSLCNDDPSGRKAPENATRSERVFSPRLSEPPNRAVVPCSSCGVYSFCANCTLQCKRCHGCGQRLSMPATKTTVKPAPRRRPKRPSTPVAPPLLKCRLNGVEASIGLSELVQWMATWHTVRLTGFEALFPVPSAPFAVRPSTFVDVFIPSGLWQSFAGAARETPPSADGK